MSNIELGSRRDQEAISPLLIEGKTLRDCMTALGWKYGRVSEASRALRGMPSDSREGRELRARSGSRRGRINAKREAMNAALRAAVARKAEAL